MKVFIQGVGLFGPGLPDWTGGRSILAGGAPWVAIEQANPAPAILNANERRRAVPTVRLALTVASEALRHAGLDPAEVPGIFASSGGDGETMHVILEALAVPPREVSPTRFTNSVHNAPSGYWTIAARCHEPATSLCAHDHSFAIGLMEAAVQCVSFGKPVLLACYDVPYPQPLHEVRPISASFGVALALAPDCGDRTVAELVLELGSDWEQTVLNDPALEALRNTNPAARSLPLLEILAKGRSGQVVLESSLGGCLTCEITA